MTLDLKTNYLGLTLANPLLVGACRMTANKEDIVKLARAGAGAIVCHSLMDRAGVDKPEAYARWLADVKTSVDTPLIASLNVASDCHWLPYAKELESSGADAIELNFYFNPLDADTEGSAVEARQVAMVQAVCSEVSLPVAVKMSYFYANPLNMASKLVAAGAGGLVVFNRLFEPDISIEEMKHNKPLNLSAEADQRLATRFAGLLHGQTKADIVANTGYLSGKEAVKALLAGADGVQVVSALYRNGSSYLPLMLQDIRNWMKSRGFASVSDFRGKLSKQTLGANTDAYERLHYENTLRMAEDLMD